MILQKNQQTNFIDKLQILNGFQTSIAKLSDKLGKTNKALSENLNPLEKESYHFVSRLLVPETRWDRILYSHIFQTALQSEKLSAGSSLISVLTAISFVETLLKNTDFLEKNEYEIMENYQSISEKFHKILEKTTNPLTNNLLEEFIKEICLDEKLTTVVLEAIELSGMEGNIQIENSESEDYSVELRYGYHFPTKLYKAFLSSFGMWIQYNCKIFLVDGIIDKVSEIDKILRKSHETKIPMVIVAQGFHEDVLSTIKINCDRKNFNIFPVTIGNDLESLNVLNDISSVTGCKVLSTLTGDMLIYADYDSLPTVDLIKCTENGMLIQNSKNRSAVGSQIQSLIEKRKYQNDRGIMDITSLFDRRISNLLAHTVIIHLPNLSKIENEHIRSKIDVALRTVKSLISYGFTNLEDLKHFTSELKHENNPIVYALLNTLENFSKNLKTNKQIPTLSIALGVYLTAKSIIQLMSSSGIVILDK